MLIYQYFFKVYYNLERYLSEMHKVFPRHKAYIAAVEFHMHDIYNMIKYKRFDDEMYFQDFSGYVDELLEVIEEDFSCDSNRELAYLKVMKDLNFYVDDFVIGCQALRGIRDIPKDVIEEENRLMTSYNVTSESLHQQTIEENKKSVDK